MFSNTDKTKEIIINCYRKFKSYVYYSNNLQFLRRKIAEFESDPSIMEEKFSILTDLLSAETDEIWDSWINQIGYKVFPKITSNTKKGKVQIISNDSSFSDINIDKVNFFIDAPIEILIVDTLWTVLIGKLIKDFRIFHDEIQANVYDERVYDEKTFSLIDSIDFKNLSIYKPYFKGYKNWKNRAIYKMDELYHREKNSTLLSLDLTSYFYSIDINFNTIKDLLSNEHDCRYNQIDKITKLIEKVYIYYSGILRELRTDIRVSQTIIPIGLVSSGVISNLYLHSLDERINNIERVEYYSRYVDDIIIVLDIANKEDSLESIFKKYLSNCFEYRDDTISVIGYPNIILQNEKIKVFKLFSSQSKQHISILKNEITNTSEPNLLPNIDMDLVSFTKNAYSHPEESIKIRDLDDLNLNVLGLMRFINSYLRSKKNTVSSIYHQQKKSKSNLPYYDRIDSETQEQLSLFFKDKTLFSLYTKWDKIFCFAILYHCDFELAYSIYNDINSNIEKIDCEYHFIEKPQQKFITKELKKSLREQLNVCFSMAFAVRYDNKLFSHFFKRKTNLLKMATLIQRSNMFDNNHVEFPMVNYYKNRNKGKTSYSGINYQEYINNYSSAELDEFSIKYAPRFIHFQEYCISQSILRIDDLNDIYFLRDVLKKYNSTILNLFTNHPNTLLIDVNAEEKTKSKEYVINNIKASSPKSFLKSDMSQIYIALANMNLEKHKMIEHGRFNFSQCTFERKSELYSLLNEAYEFTARKQRFSSRKSLEPRNSLGHHNSSLKFIAFPEISIPIEWLEEVAQFVRVTGTAIICGIKHFRNKSRVYNCVATIIPVGNTIGEYHNSFVVLREKNDYSPKEKSIIKYNNLLLSSGGKSYNCVFDWDGIRFSVFDCYELTDIFARAIMKSKLDILFAPEYNKDINYFSNIVDSASRDIYCFIAQINTSNFGGTKIVAPYRNELKDIIDIKGGEQDSIHIGSINISECREYLEFEGTTDFEKWKEDERRKEHKEKGEKKDKFRKYKMTSARHKK